MAEYTIELRSRILNGIINLRVLMPEAPSLTIQSPKEYYGSGKKLKVLWLLHPAAGGGGDWVRCTNLARYTENREVMVVLPSAFNSDYANYPVFADGYRFYDFFLEELMPYIYGWFPASAKPEDNFIAGASMGGNGAMEIGFSNPELFGGIGILSCAARYIEYLRPYRNMTSEEFRREGTDKNRFPGTYPEGFNRKEINMIAKYRTVGDFLDSPENSWDRYTENVRVGKLPKMFVTVGSEDRCRERVKLFQNLAKELGDEKTHFEIVDGYHHDYRFWDMILPRLLDYFEIF